MIKKVVALPVVPDFFVSALLNASVDKIDLVFTKHEQLFNYFFLLCFPGVNQPKPLIFLKGSSHLDGFSWVFVKMACEFFSSNPLVQNSFLAQRYRSEKLANDVLVCNMFRS